MPFMDVLRVIVVQIKIEYLQEGIICELVGSRLAYAVAVSSIAEVRTKDIRRLRGPSNPCIKHSPICKSSEGPSVQVARTWGNKHCWAKLSGKVTRLGTAFWVRLCENTVISAMCTLFDGDGGRFEGSCR